MNSRSSVISVKVYYRVAFDANEGENAPANMEKERKAADPAPAGNPGPSAAETIAHPREEVLR